MSEQEFEVYLRLMGRFLHLSGQQRETIGRELRGHMEERLEDLLARGYTREDAISTILDEFGDAASLANDFGQIGRRRKWVVRSAAGTVAVAAAVLIVCLLLPANRLPSPSLSQAGPNVATSAPSLGTSHGPDVAVAQTRAAIPVWPSQAYEADRLVREKLQRMVTLDFPEGTSFQDVLDFLAQQADLSISVNWSAVSKVAVDRTTDTNGIKLKSVKLETALTTVLENVAGGESGLDYAVVDGFVRVSTREDLDRKVSVRVYDCRDLLGQPTEQQLAALRQASPTVAVTGGYGGSGGGMGGMSTATPTGGSAVGSAGQPTDEQPKALQASPTVAVTGGGYGGGSSYGGGMVGMSTRTASSDSAIDLVEATRQYERERVDDLQQVIRSTISPGTWGPEGTLASSVYYDGLLVVTAPARTHQDLLSLLTTMRQALAARHKAASRATAHSDRSPTDGAVLSDANAELQADSIVLEIGRSRLNTATTQPARTSRGR